jgi:NAD+ synthase (glutamine-hydrolysing)
MKMWALIGYGPNDVAIPALLWTDKEKALNACIEIFGSKPKISGNSFKWEAEKHEFPRDVLKKMYISYYGGQDSTLVALVAKKAAQLALTLHGQQVTVKAITMPGTGTSDQTLENANNLAKLLELELETHPIVDSIRTILAELGHEWCGKCYQCENIQPKLRTLFAMLEGNLIGTGHVYDAYVGNTTLYGDHASMYNILAGTSKTFIPEVLRWYARQLGGETASVLNSIADLPPSAELLPLGEDGAVEQLTAEVMGPIDLMEFFLYHDFRFGYTAQKLIFLAAAAFEDEYTAEELLYWLARAYGRFFGQRYKQLSIPPGVMVGSVCHSPRGALRMPSDALSNVWLAEVNALAQQIGLPGDWSKQVAESIGMSRKK